LAIATQRKANKREGFDKPIPAEGSGAEKIIFAFKKSYIFAPAKRIGVWRSWLAYPDEIGMVVKFFISINVL
jgi:hypothetical protein